MGCVSPFLPPVGGEGLDGRPAVWLARGRDGGGSRSSQIELLELVEKSCLEGWVGRGVALGYSVSSLGVVRMLFAL